MNAVELDDEGTLRFKENRIIKDMLADSKRYDLNHIFVLYQKGVYTRDEYWQLLQLTGYSLYGFMDAIGSELDDGELEENE